MWIMAVRLNHRIHAAEEQKTSAAFLCVLATQKLTKREAEEEKMTEKEKNMVEVLLKKMQESGLISKEEGEKITVLNMETFSPELAKVYL